MDAREKKKKKPDKKTFEDAMQDIDSWTKSLETTKKSNSRTGSSGEPRSKKPILVEFKKDIQTGNYKWKNPGKVYKRRKIQVNEAASADVKDVQNNNSNSQTPSYEPEQDVFIENEADANTSETWSKRLQEVIEELCQLETEFPAVKKDSNWEARKRALDENWASIRQSLFHDCLVRNCIPKSAAVCGICQTEKASIRCISCLKLLCSKCDTEIHKKLAFHDRECWVDGFYTSLGNRCSIEENKRCEVVRPLPVFPPSPCPECHQGLQFSAQCTSKIVTIITTKGRFEFNETYFQCNNCSGNISGSSHFLMMMSGYWPGSPQNTETFYSTELLQFWDTLSNNSPGTSLSSFVKTIESTSKASGRVGAINATSFGRAYREWAFCQTALREEKGKDRFSCPVCSNCCHSIHIDGHRKTYRFKKVPRGTDEPFYQNTFIVNDDDVHMHMKKIYEKTGSQDYADDKLCGGSYWQAARSHSKKSFSSLDETGLVVAGCRHVIALNAVNMFAGEQYGYTLYLHNLLFNTNRMKFLWLDIMCKYWPWLQRVAEKLPEVSPLLGTKKALSVLHSKVHSLDCQMVWGGTYQDAAALSTGESMEQFFSYLAKCGITTKNMNAAARSDTLTERTGFWNERKIDNLAQTLSNQYAKTQKKMKQLNKEKQNLMMEARTNVTDEMVNKWKSELKNNALRSLQRGTSSAITNQVEEYFRLSREIEGARALANFAQTTDKAGSIVIGQEDMYDMISKHRKDVVAKEKRFMQLEKKLLSEGHNREELLRDGKKCIVDHNLELLQTRIVHLYLNINQQNCEISRLADTSKKRIKLRKAMSSNKVTLKTTVEKHNTILKLNNSASVEINVDDVMIGKFSWNDEKAATGVPEWLKKRIVDKCVLLERCNEELVLCAEEMRAFCSFYKDKVHSLEKQVEDLKEKTRDTNTAERDDAIDAIGVEALTNQNKKRYCLKEAPSVGQLMGLIAMKTQAVATCKKKISEGVALFQKVLGNFEVPEDEDNEDSNIDDEDDFVDENASDDADEDSAVEDSILF